ncbi:winged helix-turn-helix domain-containing protein [Acidicapsa ligni]|uniref:winged helix-turn-helix domain-containing protein n=1 Tax=Acidicapsa ligni TaxID=542300 RepID=UPI0021DFF5C6|nr:winged helix-turn-helix domain-containing protein [Acidicapsa ligni]
MPLIRFGEFEFNEQTLELRRSGAPVRVQQQPARVLAFLLNHQGKLVTRQQIQQAIWGQDTFVDFEQNLNFCIRQIRISLNDQAEKPVFIETLPRLGYRFLASAEKIGDGATKTVRNRIRIGILPIEDVGGSANDYFAIGLTEDMISALSRIDPARLRVTVGPRAPSGILPREELDRLQREFDLDYLLRGSVRRSAEAVRISAQLLDLRDKSVLWSEVYDLKSSDLLGVQEDVARRVSQSLVLELLPGGALGSRKYVHSSAAYDAYLKGRFFWHKMTTDTVRSSMAYFNEALTIDPEFAPAYAGLADCYAQMGSIRLGMLQPYAALEKARTYLHRAMELDYTMAEAHCTSGLIKIWYEFDWAGAEQAFQVALSLDPGHVTALLWQSLLLSVMGRNQEAIASVQRARDSEPLSPVVNMYLGVAQTHAGQYDLALRQLHQTLELDPHNYRTFMFLGRALSSINRQNDAIAAYEKSIALNPDGLEAIAMLGASMAASGDRSGALKTMERVVATESRTSPAVLVAIIYASLGDAQQMFDWLSKAVDQKSAPIYLPLITEDFRPYRSDPRFRLFLESIGLAHLAIR